MKNRNYILLALTLIVICIGGCKKNDADINQDLPPFNPTPLKISIPANLPLMQIPDYNKTTVEGVALGRMLYYDSLLHPTGAKACASCHLQPAGFTTPGTNIIPHINLGYANKFLWNGAKQGTLEDVMMFEVTEFFGADISKLQKDARYPMLFYKAFGSTTITSEKCAYALAQFLRTMVSGNSKYDRFIRGELWLTAEENYGYQIFFSEKGDCFHCHSLSLTTDGNLHNIGLDSVFNGADAGYYTVSNNPVDLGRFKTPSLRNCGIRTSFMHDGRFTTLDQVIEHYNSLVQITPSVDPIMTKPGKAYGLKLLPIEKQQLKAFLNTLTDSVFLSDTSFSSPF